MPVKNGVHKSSTLSFRLSYSASLVSKRAIYTSVVNIIYVKTHTYHWATYN